MFLPRSVPLLAILVSCANLSAFASGQESPCKAEDRECVMALLETSIGKINEDSWRDASFREYAKTLAFDGRTDEAIAIIGKVVNPDTRAMTIRGIGMAMAANKSPPEVYRPVFLKLAEEAAKITHPPSHAIALTYIAMAQAFAGDDEGATKTALSMENEALRNKALGESAEIQAERGDYKTAMESIGHIASSSFRNKAYATVSQIFSKAGRYDDALNTSLKIDNPTVRADTLQYLLDQQKPREMEKIRPVTGGGRN